MGVKDFLLKPFRKHFNPPDIDIPISTIEMPSVKFCMIIISISFIIISGGIVYCWVQGAPMIGYIRNRDGSIGVSWYEPRGISSQFGAEGIIASSVYTLGALSLLAGVTILSKGTNDDSMFSGLLYMFACSSPLWMILAIAVFQTKIPGYFPLPR